MIGQYSLRKSRGPSIIVNGSESDRRPGATTLAHTWADCRRPAAALRAVVVAAGVTAALGALCLDVLQATSQTRPLKERRDGRLFPPLDLGLLEAPDRDAWQRPDLIMDVVGIADGAIVADLGAGGGYFTSHLARRVGPNGLVFAQDIQPQMIEAIARRVQRENLRNVRTILGTGLDPRLPQGLDAALIVDSYHEMNDPARPDVIRTFLGNIAAALKPHGRLGIVGFTPGGGGPGPAPEDRVDPETVIATAASAGLRLLGRERVPPFQFLLVFGRTTGATLPTLSRP